MSNIARPEAQYKRTFESPRLKWSVRLEALNLMQRPSLSMLSRVLKDPLTPKKLAFEIAKRLDAETMKIKLRKQGQEPDSRSELDKILSGE